MVPKEFLGLIWQDSIVVSPSSEPRRTEMDDNKLWTMETSLKFHALSIITVATIAFDQEN